MQSLHACPKGVQGLHALQTGVQALHACLARPARLLAMCTPIVGVRHAGEGVRGLARLKRKARSPRTPFSLGVRGGVRTPFGRAAIKPQKVEMMSLFNLYIFYLFIMFNYFYNIIKTYIELAYLLFFNKNNLIVILL